MHLVRPPADRRPPSPQPPGFIWPVRVYYEDTDAAGVVYYANYLRFCERARTEWLREAGFSQQQLLAERGLAFVVRSVNADYLLPAVLDDALRVVSRIAHLGRASIEFNQQIVRGSERVFEAQVTIACVDWQRRKPAAMTPDLRTQLSRLAPA